MVWDRFHFQCRVYNNELKAELAQNEGRASSDISASESAANERVVLERGKEFYGAAIKRHSIPFDLLMALDSIGSPQESQKKAAIYGALDFSKALEKTPRLRGIFAYQICLTVVFLLVCAVYQLKVTPEFVSVFDTFNVSPPNYLGWYMEFWYVPIGLIFLMLVASLGIVAQINHLFEYKNVRLDSFFCKIFIPQRIRASYINIVEIVSYPMLGVGKSSLYRPGLLTAYLSDIERSNLNLVTEIQVLLRREANQFSLMIERYLQAITAIISVTIIASIFLFLYSAYAPIFIMGEVT